MDEVRRGARAVRLLREDLSELGVRVRELPGLRLAHGLELLEYRPRLPEPTRALAHVARAAAHDRGHLGLAVPASRERHQDPLPLGHRRCPFS